MARSAWVKGLLPSGFEIEPGEERGLAHRELVQGLPPRPERAPVVADQEEAGGGGLEAVRVGTQVHGVQVLDEDLVLRELLVQAEGVLDLLDLAVHVALRREQPVLHQLLGDGRATLLDPPRRDVGEERPEHRAEVDAVVAPERTVLGRDHRVDHRLRHLVDVGDGIAVLGGEVGQLGGAVGVVRDRGLGERAQLTDLLGGVVVCSGDLDRARDQRREAGAHRNATDDDREQEGDERSAETAHEGLPAWHSDPRSRGSGGPPGL